MKKGIVSGIDMLILMSKQGLMGIWLGVLQKRDSIDIVSREGYYTKIKFEATEGYVRSRFVLEV